MNAKLKARDSLLDDKRVNPQWAATVKRILSKLRDKGIPAVVVEVYRSPARAALMKATGKSKNGVKSKHTIGKAADIAFEKNGKLSWDVDPAWWSLLGSLAEAEGAVWGGRWRMRDYNHIEMR